MTCHKYFLKIPVFKIHTRFYLYHAGLLLGNVVMSNTQVPRHSRNTPVLALQISPNCPGAAEGALLSPLSTWSTRLLAPYLRPFSPSNYLGVEQHPGGGQTTASHRRRACWVTLLPRGRRLTLCFGNFPIYRSGSAASGNMKSGKNVTGSR